MLFNPKVYQREHADTCSKEIVEKTFDFLSSAN